MASSSQNTPQSRGWTPERRAKHAAAMRRWSPWSKSTGPKTASGKARSARNAYKHGRRSLDQRLKQALLINQKRLHEALAARAALFEARNSPNELLKNPTYKMLNGALHDGIFLMCALLWPSIMQKPCIFGPPEDKS